MRYVIVFEEPKGSGCGYSIGCGKLIDDVEADTPEEALRIAIEENWFGCDPAEDYAKDPFEGSDINIASVRIYEASLIDDGKLFEEYHRRLVERLKQRDEAEVEDNERAEYERLKEKFDP